MKARKNYGFLVTLVFEVVLIVVDLTMVSFFKLSGFDEISFFIVSTMVLLDESVLTESVLAVPLPLQAANEAAIAKATNVIFNEFFMVMFFNL
jgi:hypothetical protein